MKGCEWIHDHPGDPGWPTYCGARRASGRPYCVDHCIRAYRLNVRGDITQEATREYFEEPSA